MKGCSGGSRARTQRAPATAGALMLPVIPERTESCIAFGPRCSGTASGLVKKPVNDLRTFFHSGTLLLYITNIVLASARLD